MNILNPILPLLLLPRPGEPSPCMYKLLNQLGQCTCDEDDPNRCQIPAEVAKAKGAKAARILPKKE